MTHSSGEEMQQAWLSLEEGDVESAHAAYERARALFEQARAAQQGGDGAGGPAAAPAKAAPANGEQEAEQEAAKTVDEHTMHAAELAALGATLAEISGDLEAALGGFHEALALMPDEVGFLISAAELSLSVLDGPEATLALCDRVLDLATEDYDLVSAALLKSEALLGTDDESAESEARELLAELDGCAIEDPLIWCRAGDVYLTLEALEEAARAYQAAIELDDTWADAYHGLGTVYHEQHQHAESVAAWQTLRTLDLAAPAPALHMSTDEFSRVAEAALSEIPEKARALLENVPILVDDMPSEALVAEGIDPRVLGLFSGVPLPEKSTAGGAVPALDTIHLFQRNLERTSSTLDELAEEIRITVLHETAHFFGLDDDDLDAIGLG
ncbi:MAG: hypothetical protein Tsb0020_39090 [Haliangiales bacterium]